MSPIAPLFRSLLPVWMAISAAFTVAASSAASNDKTFDAALIEYLEHASNVQPEQTVATQATTNTVKAIENVLSEESREAVRHRCLETLAIILRSHNADTALDIVRVTGHLQAELLAALKRSVGSGTIIESEIPAGLERAPGSRAKTPAP